MFPLVRQTGKGIFVPIHKILSLTSNMSQHYFVKYYCLKTRWNLSPDFVAEK